METFMKLSLENYMESKTTNLEDLYVSAGDRTYVVGAQNGMFPDFGHHIENEMGGVWNHPIKLLDGYWLQISDRHSGKKDWLETAKEFRNYPFYNEHDYYMESFNLNIIRRQFCPDGLEGVVVSYRIENLSETTRNLDISFLARTDLSPVWFSEEIGIKDAEDEGRLESSKGIFIAKDLKNDWFVVFGGSLPYDNGVIEKDLFGPEKTAGKGITGKLTYENISISPNKTTEIYFFISGSYRAEGDAIETFNTLKRDHVQLFENKKKRYEKLLEKTKVMIPDKQLENVFNWVKFNNDWLIRDVPEVGRGLGAGIPEYPWWFGCDNSYALLGILPLGEQELAEQTLQLIHDESMKENGNGRIIHEISTNGAVANKGNTQETPHFIKCVWDTFLWSGNIAFLKSVYPTVKKGIRWLLEEMDPDGDLYPEGYGIIEIEGLNVELIDSAVYTYSALQAAAKMAELFGEDENAKVYHGIAEVLGEKINKEWWIESEDLYADCIAKPSLIHQKIDTYIERAKNHGAPNAVTDMEKMKEQIALVGSDEQRPWLFKNWVINTPMEIGLAPKDKAIRALNRMGTDEFKGPWGTYLSGMYQTSMMTISTSVQAVAECRYDRTDEALSYVKQIVSTFNKRLPGSISEMSPDYGCFVQAWTAYGVAWPLITHMFGVNPRAYWKEVIVRPRMPKEWNNTIVEKVIIGTEDKYNAISVLFERANNEESYKFVLERSDWTVFLDLQVEKNQKVLLDGKRINPIVTPDGNSLIEINNAKEHVLKIIIES